MTDTAATWDGPLQILSLDGGGIKGLLSAAVLAMIEEDLGIIVADHFDLIAGTSTGGIIALALGLGMRPREIVNFYVDNGPRIFKSRFGIRNLTYWGWRKFPATALESALRECFKDRLLQSCRKRLVIPSYNLGDDDVYIFKTRHHNRLRRDYKVPMWKVAMATTSAPTYFSSFRGINNLRLIDGGVWANNPCLVAVVEATSMLNARLDQIRVLSLGTSDSIPHRKSRLNCGGKLFWASTAVDVVMRGQSIGAVNQACHLLGTKNVLRLDPKVPDGMFRMDKPDAATLLGKAAHESRQITPTIREMFCGHIAKEFTSIPID